MLERLFRLKRNNTDVKTEVVAGITTFMTLSYIIFVQPTVLSACGMDFGAVLVATCVASAAATFLMGFYANYPVALAPGMGHIDYRAIAEALRDIGYEGFCTGEFMPEPDALTAARRTINLIRSLPY